MSYPVISVENLSKSYRLGQIGTGTLTNDLKVWAARVRGKPNPLLRIGQTDHGNRSGEILWALKDVSFKVEQGEVLGIIGRNGAGKSTLLKILSRVTAPTSGCVKVKGRIASLLEVGTGFHPELTGRENIYLNGAILGMTKEEVRRKFDEIVAFAEIDKFIDTPVKRYSSGMYVRLAFAVAAHLQSEILLVDEVLAVGDAEFQKKCLGKMGDVAAQEGRTVLFVSHQIGMIKTLCKNTLILENGIVGSFGLTQIVADSYLNSAKSFSKERTLSTFEFNRKAKAQISSVTLLKEDTTRNIDINNKLTVYIKYLINTKLIGAAIILKVKRNGEIIFISFDTDLESKLLTERGRGNYETYVDLPSPLKPGRYTLDIVIGVLNSNSLDEHENCIEFVIDEDSVDINLKSYSSRRPGIVAYNTLWKTIKKND